MALSLRNLAAQVLIENTCEYNHDTGESFKGLVVHHSKAIATHEEPRLQRRVAGNSTLFAEYPARRCLARDSAGRVHCDGTSRISYIELARVFQTFRQVCVWND
jgi:hypothetical protein